MSIYSKLETNLKKYIKFALNGGMHHQVQPQDDFNIQINHTQINQLTNNSIWDNFNPFNEPMIQYVQQQTQSVVCSYYKSCCIITSRFKTKYKFFNNGGNAIFSLFRGCSHGSSRISKLLSGMRSILVFIKQR